MKSKIRKKPKPVARTLPATKEWLMATDVHNAGVHMSRALAPPSMPAKELVRLLFDYLELDEDRDSLSVQPAEESDTIIVEEPRRGER